MGALNVFDVIFQNRAQIADLKQKEKNLGHHCPPTGLRIVGASSQHEMRHEPMQRRGTMERYLVRLKPRFGSIQAFPINFDKLSTINSRNSALSLRLRSFLASIREDVLHRISLTRSRLLLYPVRRRRGRQSSANNPGPRASQRQPEQRHHTVQATLLSSSATSKQRQQKPPASK